MASPETAVHELVVRTIAREISEMDLLTSPPVMAQKIHRLVRRVTGNPDPYRNVKQESNRRALELLPAVSQWVRRSVDRMQMAVRMAMAGNIIDFGVEERLRSEAVGDVLRRAQTATVVGPLDAFSRQAKRADSVLFLADNAGEIVLDRVLVEEIGASKVTVVVRGSPVLNDALEEDAAVAGLTAMVDVIGNGSDAPGTILEDCSDELRRRFAAADMVIAKGQGNYESLSGVQRPVWCLLMAKCPVIADHIGCESGSFVIRKAGAVDE